MNRVGQKRNFRGLRLLLGSLLFSAMLPFQAAATPLCLRTENSGIIRRELHLEPGREVRLSFQHSIYGSRVEEIFRLRADGFELTELRYAEARLVGFYGHEKARFENAMWIVKPRATLISSLSLRTTSAASLFFDRPTVPVNFAVPTGSALRLTVGACKDGDD